MNKTILSKQVKQEILSICSGPVLRAEQLAEDIRLKLLGYDEYEEWCRQLEIRLQYIASQFQTGKEIVLGNITPHTTVNECIEMVM